MKTKILATVVAMFLASTAYAADLEGSVGVEFAENSANDVVATTTIDLGVTGIAGGSFANVGLESTDSSTIVIDTYQIGTTIGGVTLSYGKQEDLFASPGLEVIGGETLATPSDNFESLRATTGAFAVQLGFTDVSRDVADLENLQLAAGTQLGVVSLDMAIDYNFDTENTVTLIGVDVDAGVAVVGLDMSYDNNFAYELSASRWGVTGFVNGDENNAVQNIGAGYSLDYNEISFYVEAGYNVDTEETTPAAGVAFSF